MDLSGKINIIVKQFEVTDYHNFKKAYLFDELNKNTGIERVKDALKLVNLNDDYISKKTNNLSTQEYNRLSLAIDLANNLDEITLFYFEREMNEKDRIYFKRLFTKLTKKYNKTINLVTNNLSFCFDFADNYLFVEDDKVIDVLSKNDIFTSKYIDRFSNNDLLRFILLSREYGYLKDNYYEIKEIMKAVYREKV